MLRAIVLQVLGILISTGPRTSCCGQEGKRTVVECDFRISQRKISNAWLPAPPHTEFGSHHVDTIARVFHDLGAMKVWCESGVGICGIESMLTGR
jgi:hypothetical protein